MEQPRVLSPSEQEGVRRNVATELNASMEALRDAREALAQNLGSARTIGQIETLKEAWPGLVQRVLNAYTDIPATEKAIRDAACEAFGNDEGLRIAEEIFQKSGLAVFSPRDSALFKRRDRKETAGSSSQ